MRFYARSWRTVQQCLDADIVEGMPFETLCGRMSFLHRDLDSMARRDHDAIELRG